MKTLLLFAAAGCSQAQILVPIAGNVVHGGATSYYSRSITIDHTKVPNTDQTNFPVMVRSLIGTVNTTSVANAVTLTAGDQFPTYMTTGYPIRIASAVYTIATRVNGSALTLTTSPGIQTAVAYNSTPFWATVANGGALTNANGYDNIFGTTNTCGTKYDWDREYWSATTGEGIFWVRIPTLATASNTVPQDCYGDASITTDQSNKNGTWNSAFKLVIHCPDGTTLTCADSTSNANNGTIANATASTGQVDGAAHFNGTNAEIHYGTSATLDVTDPSTVSCWLKGIGGGTEVRAFARRNGGGGWSFGVGGDDKAYVTFFGVAGVSSTGTMPGTGWHHIAVSIGSGVASFFIDGAASGTPSLSPAITASTLNLYSGVALDGSGNITAYEQLDIDECHISNVARGGDWIVTEYNNQSDPGSFEALGAEVAH